MKQYLKLLNAVMNKGSDRSCPRGKTRTLFGQQLRFNLAKGFPIMTTREVDFADIRAEAVLILNGGSSPENLAELKAGKFHGDLNETSFIDYGPMWTCWEDPASLEDKFVDQLANALQTLREGQNGIGPIITSFDPTNSVNPACCTTQFLRDGMELSCSVTMPDADCMTKVPHATAVFALITNLIGKVVGLVPSELVMNLGESYIYHEHFDAVNKQLNRKPLKLPKLQFGKTERTAFEYYDPDDLALADYVFHESIKIKEV